MAATNPALCRYVDRLILNRFGTASALAEAIGMSASAFSHGVREEGTLSVENCLRLADVLGERPSVILKLAKKPEMAALSERLYGARMTLSPREKELITIWRTLDEDARNAHETLIQISKQRAQNSVASTTASPSGASKPDLKSGNSRPPPSKRSRAGSTSLAATG